MRVHIRTAALFSRPLVEVEVEQENAKTLWILVWRKIAGGGLYRDSIGPSRTGGGGEDSEFQLLISTHFNKGASRAHGQSGISNNSTMSSR